MQVNDGLPGLCSLSPCISCVRYSEERVYPEFWKCLFAKLTMMLFTDAPSQEGEFDHDQIE